MPSNRPQRRQSPNNRPQQRPNASSRAPRPGASKRPSPTPASQPGFRAQLERASYPVLVRLTRAPKLLVFAVTVAVLLAGLFAPNPWGTIAMAIVTLFVLWLWVLAWPKLDTQGRVVRGLVTVAAATVVFFRATGSL